MTCSNCGKPVDGLPEHIARALSLVNCQLLCSECIEEQDRQLEALYVDVGGEG